MKIYSPFEFLKWIVKWNLNSKVAGISCGSTCVVICPQFGGNLIAALICCKSCGSCGSRNGLQWRTTGNFCLHNRGLKMWWLCGNMNVKSRAVHCQDFANPPFKVHHVGRPPVQCDQQPQFLSLDQGHDKDLSEPVSSKKVLESCTWRAPDQTPSCPRCDRTIALTIFSCAFSGILRDQADTPYHTALWYSRCCRMKAM